MFRVELRVGWMAVAAVCVASACAAPHAVPTVFGTQARIERYLTGGSYDEEFRRVVTRAEAYMVQRATRVAKPAIVLDIDETSLSNWPAYRVNGGQTPHQRRFRRLFARCGRRPARLLLVS